MFKKSFLVFLLSLCVGTVAFAQYEDKSYSDLLVWAKQGDPQAQAQLAYRLKEGIEVNKDLKGARKWAKAAAKANNGLAYWILAQLDFEAGQRSFIDDLNQAAFSCNYPLAISLFARVYNSGDAYMGIEKDEDNAIELFREAALLGDVEAAAYLGSYYLKTIGDTAEAFKFFDIASKLGDVESMSMTASMLGNGVGTRQDLIASYNWYKKAAEGGSQSGIEGLADCYRLGFGTSPDQASAFNYYQQIKQPSTRIQFILGYYYGKDEGLIKDYSKALSLLSKSAESGYAYSNALLGFALYEGVAPYSETEQDVEKALPYLKVAFDNPDFDQLSPRIREKVLRYLSAYYRYGKGVAKDLNLAEKLWNQAVALQSDAEDDDSPFASVGMMSFEETERLSNLQRPFSSPNDIIKRTVLDYQPSGAAIIPETAVIDDIHAALPAVAESSAAEISSAASSKSNSGFAMRVEGSFMPGTPGLGLTKVYPWEEHRWFDSTYSTFSVMLGGVTKGGVFIGLGVGQGVLPDLNASGNYGIYHGCLDINIPFLPRKSFSPFIEGFAGAAYEETDLGLGFNGGGALGFRLRLAKHFSISVGVKASYQYYGTYDNPYLEVVTVLPTVGITI